MCFLPTTHSGLPVYVHFVSLRFATEVLGNSRGPFASFETECGVDLPSKVSCSEYAKERRGQNAARQSPRNGESSRPKKHIFFVWTDRYKEIFGLLTNHFNIYFKFYEWATFLKRLERKSSNCGGRRYRKSLHGNFSITPFSNVLFFSQRIRVKKSYCSRKKGNLIIKSSNLEGQERLSLINALFWTQFLHSMFFMTIHYDKILWWINEIRRKFLKLNGNSKLNVCIIVGVKTKK